VSGKACATSLTNEGFDVIEIDVSVNLWEQLSNADPDIVFNALHGDWGEDGRVQGVLDLFGAPYTHSGLMASALAMDKHRSKVLFRDMGINVPFGFLVPRETVSLEHPLTRPYVIKPNGQGSSKDIFIVEKGDDPIKDLKNKDKMGDLVLIEEFCPGRELTVTVMDGKAIGVTEVVPTSSWYDFDSKYKKDGSRHIIPAIIDSEISDLCLTWAVLAHNALGCRGITRSDFKFNDDKQSNSSKDHNLVMLELNTQPGMTPTSLAPEQAEKIGISFDKLCRWIVEDASWPR
jgi:D-alanine-D-alanine ligase